MSNEDAAYRGFYLLSESESASRRSADDISRSDPESVPRSASESESRRESESFVRVVKVS